MGIGYLLCLVEETTTPSEAMPECVAECVTECVAECMAETENVCVAECMAECMAESENECGRVCGRCNCGFRVDELEEKNVHLRLQLNEVVFCCLLLPPCFSTAS